MQVVTGVGLSDAFVSTSATASYSCILSDSIWFYPSLFQHSVRSNRGAGRIGRYQLVPGIQSIRSRLAWKMPVPQSPPNRTCLTRCDKQNHGIPRTPLKSFEVWRIQPWNGSGQDVTHYSLPYGRLETVPETTKQCIFWGFGSATWQDDRSNLSVQDHRRCYD